ncbi:hypothetical protein DH2020_023277 [Rehmannia glutinosa]|uniref:F-box domain-containing protein n=1 Tax=Rehmannia glutinosa TaxID=99300 RepID=A0ABR0W7D5_REHGL
MAGDNCLHVKGQTCPFYLRRCIRRMLKTNIDSLPDDIVFDILVHIPAQDIYNATRLVCRKWYQMILTHNFIHVHLQHSTCGLLIKNWLDRTSHPTFVAMRQGRIEISKLSDKSNHLFLSSCNGLILEFDCLKSYALYIANSTKQRSALPTFSANTTSDCSAIAYAATSMEYKVVNTCYFMNGNTDEFEHDCAILTVGVDKSWRRVNIQHLSLTAKELLKRTPFATQGFVHWAQNNLRVVNGEPQYILTLNVETEIFTQIPVPLVHGERLGCYHYLSMGSYLSLLIDCSEFSWEVWEMKPETGEWTKMPKIDLEAQKCIFEQLCCKYDSSGSLTCSLLPVGWLKSKEVLVFNVFKEHTLPIFISPWFCIAYNVRTREIYSIELDSICNTFLVHRNSLVWLDGC